MPGVHGTRADGTPTDGRGLMLRAAAEGISVSEALRRAIGQCVRAG